MHLLASRLTVLGGLDEPLRVQPAAVEIEGREIVAVHPLDPHRYVDQVADLQRGTGAELHDLGELALTPAWINGHTHLALGFLRAFDVHGALADNVVEELFFRVEAGMTEEDVRAFVRMGAYENLLHGVGMVWDHYYRGESVAAALRDVGLAGVVAPTLQDLSGPGHDAWEDQLEATARLAHDGGLADAGIFAALGPHATDTVSAELWRRAADLAEAESLPLHAHVAQSIQEVRRAHERHGRSPLSWLCSLGVLERIPTSVLTHCLYASRPDLEQLDPRRQVLAFCPYAQLVFGFPADASTWTDVGLRWVLGTDVAAGNDSSSVQKEMRAVAGLRTAGVPHGDPYRRFLAQGSLDAAEQVWRDRGDRFASVEATTTAPELLTHVWSVPGSLHPAFRAGAIEVGCLANLAVWDRDHPTLWPCPDGDALLQALALGDTSEALAWLWVAGRPIGERDNFHGSVLRSDAYREALSEAQQRLESLLRHRR